jgi:hypothetical protein
MIADTKAVMSSRIDLTQLSKDQNRHLAEQVMATPDEKDAALNEKDMPRQERDETIRQYDIRNSHLTHEIALPERRQLSHAASQLVISLLDALYDEDIVAVETELELLIGIHREIQSRMLTQRHQPLPKQFAALRDLP